MERGTEPTLQSIAEQWASTQADLKRLEERERLAKDEAQRLRARAGTLADQMSKRVGANRSLRVFNVATGEVVIVEHERGVRLVETEPKEK